MHSSAQHFPPVFGHKDQVDVERETHSVCLYENRLIFVIDQLYNSRMIAAQGLQIPTEDQSTHVRQQCIKNAGACRFIWNKILSINEHRYLAGVPRLNYYDAWALVAWMKQSEEYGWLKDANAESLQQCLIDLERAYTQPVRRASRTRRSTARSSSPTASAIPRASRWMADRSTCPRSAGSSSGDSRVIDGTVKNVTVSRQGTALVCRLPGRDGCAQTPCILPRLRWGLTWGLLPLPRSLTGALHPPSMPIDASRPRKPVCNGDWLGMVQVFAELEETPAPHCQTRYPHCQLPPRFPAPTQYRDQQKPRGHRASRTCR